VAVAGAPAAGVRGHSSSMAGLRRPLLGCAVALAMVAAGPYVLPDFMINSLIRAFLYAVVALTVDLLWGYAGILTFGQSAYFGIGAYAMGLTFSHLGFSTVLGAIALLAGLVAAVAVAALVGWLSFHHGASPLYASVVSLVLPIVMAQLIYSGGTFTGSSSGLSGFESFDVSVPAWFWIAGAFLSLLTTAAWLFARGDAGRVLVAMRENEPRCEFLGIDVARTKILLLVVSAAIAALAGYVYAGYTLVIAPDLAGFAFGTELVIWVALGGRGTIIGPVIGTLLIDVSTAYLSGNLPFVWKLLLGVAFVTVIVALPQGLTPPILSIMRRLAGRAGTPPPSPVALTAAARLVVADGPAALAIEAHDVRKRFGSLGVLDGIDFTAARGELLSLVGPNGAGKTTLMRCIADGTERSGGTISVNGHDIGHRPPYQCVAFGVGRKFQTANAFDSLTVAESMRIACTRLERPSLWRRSPTLELPEAALQVLRATGLDAQVGCEVRHLSHGMKQALELAMVLALQPTVLLLDEPTAGLTKSERSQVGEILSHLTRAHDLCVLLVEHDLDFVREISSRVIVLHQGRIVLDGSVTEVVESELVRMIYAGGQSAAVSGRA
jgi:branched-chain amino acid transport system permease protein